MTPCVWVCTNLCLLLRYFYIPARKEHRGIGGLFFDDLEAEGAPYDVQAYVQVRPKLWLRLPHPMHMGHTATLVLPNRLCRCPVWAPCLC